MKYNEELMKAQPFDIYVPIEKGTTKREHKPLDEFPAMKKVNRIVTRLDLRDKSDDVILRMTLKALGVEDNQNVTSMYLLCSTLLQAKILLDSEEYIAIESIDGYIANTMLVTNITKKSYLEDFANLLDGFHKWENGKVVLDEEKKAEYLSTLQGG